MRSCGAPTLVPWPSSVRANMSRAHAPKCVESAFSIRTARVFRPICLRPENIGLHYTAQKRGCQTLENDGSAKPYSKYSKTFLCFPQQSGALLPPIASSGCARAHPAGKGN